MSAGAAASPTPEPVPSLVQGASGPGPTAPLEGALRRAIAAGLLPRDAILPAGDGRPWPVVVLTALGAWLAAIPLLGVVSILLGDLLSQGAGPYLVGILVLAAAVVVLRSRDLPLFVEQLAVPGLLVGLGSLAFGLFDDLSEPLGAATLAAISLGLAAVVPRPWLRVLLGAAGAGLCVIALVPERTWLRGGWGVAAWAALHGALGIWVAGLGVQAALLGRGAGARVAAALEPIGTGWLVATLAGLAFFSGMTFLAGASLDSFGRDLAQELTGGRAPVPPLPWRPAGSAVLTLAAVLWGARAWPALRRPWVLGVGVAAAGLAWFLPNLGGVCLALVLTATTRRWRLAAVAGLVAAWIIGSFYYQLEWPLATKALVLVVTGAVLGALAWTGARSSPRQRDDARQRPGAGLADRWAIGLTLLATLAVVNFGIWDKETLIARGQPLFVELGPVDPRSLMQGDYMRLAFRIPAEAQTQMPGQRRGPRLVVARRDGRGVATLLRLARPGEALGEGELLLELTLKAGRWTLVSDAWYFKEGDAKRWEAARFGEFRATPDGRALLVGMADAELRPIGP